MSRGRSVHPATSFQAARRRTSQTVAVMSSTASASSQPPSIHWNGQNRLPGWYQLPEQGTGWFTVAIGGTLLAAGNLADNRAHHWPVWLFWLLIVVMLIAAVLNTAIRMSGGQRARRSAGVEPAPAAEPH